ncbi:nucleoside-diphosphate sugar epimerase/dehydratase, partial [Seonamhaeicola marinus]
PDNRLQIVYFYFAILVALIVWRLAYINFIVSPRFYRKALIVGETSYIETIIEAFKDADPNYKIVGFVNCEANSKESIKFNGVKEYSPKDLKTVVANEHISEIVVASYNAETITYQIYYALISLLEDGIPIREYTHVYEDLTERIPVQFVGKDFYKYFPFSRSNQNKMYLFFRRFFDVFVAAIGLVWGVLFLPVVLMGNVLANRGP